MIFAFGTGVVKDRTTGERLCCSNCERCRKITTITGEIVAHKCECDGSFIFDYTRYCIYWKKKQRTDGGTTK